MNFFCRMLRERRECNRVASHIAAAMHVSLELAPNRGDIEPCDVGVRVDTPVKQRVTSVGGC
jgi:hypothetical protein